jgi:hypothetical protein
MTLTMLLTLFFAIEGSAKIFLAFIVQKLVLHFFAMYTVINRLLLKTGD